MDGSPTTDQLQALLFEGLKTERHDLNRAQSLAQDALALSRRLQSPEGEARALRNVAYCRYASGSTDDALELLDQALTLATSLDAQSAMAICFHTRGYILHHSGRLNEALDAYEAAADRREALGEDSLLAGTLNNLGTIWFNLGDYDSCLTVHRKALQLWRAVNNQHGEAITLHNLGNTYAALGEETSATLSYRQALGIVEHHHLTSLQCEIATTLARLYRKQGNLAEAQATLDRVAHWLSSLQEPLSQALLQEEQGLLLRQQGCLREARKPLADALRHYRNQRAPIHSARLLYEVGQLYLASQAPRRACRALERSRQQAQAHQLKKTERDACEALANAHEACQDTAMALRFHRRFHALDRELFAESPQRQRLVLLRQIELEKAQRENENLTRANAQLQELATKDGMTGLQNHRAFHETLRAMVLTTTETALLLIDVEHFKSFNDTFGHPAGDEVLRQVAELLRQSVRDGDQLGRYGGEEFAVLLPNTDQHRATALAERICRVIGNHAFPHRKVTVSIGVTTTKHSGHEPTQLIQDADQALYAAKHAGRNCILKAA